jgi:hypothetical protein
VTWKVVELAQMRTFGPGPGAKPVSGAVRKAVMMALANFASADGGGIYAAVPTVATLAEVSDRVVRRCISDFAAAGLLTLEGSRSCRSGRVNQWRIELATLKKLPLAIKREQTESPASRSRLASTSGDASPERGAALTRDERHLSPEHSAGLANDLLAESPEHRAPEALNTASASPERGAAKPFIEPANKNHIAPMPIGPAAWPTASAREEWQDRLDRILDGFDDVLSANRDDDEGINDLKHHAKTHAFEAVQVGAQKWFVTHRRRQRTDGEWKPLNRPLSPKHPKLVQQIDKAAATLVPQRSHPEPHLEEQVRHGH